MAESIPDYYAVLGVARSATYDEIRVQYRRVAREVHPDRNPLHQDLPPGSPDIRVVNEAWDVLGDPNRRAVYDRETQPRESPKADDPPEPRLPPVPDGFLLHPRPMGIGWARGQKSHYYRPWRNRAADHIRKALSLAAETRDLSNLSRLDADDLWLLDVRDVPVTDSDLRAVTRFRRLEILLLDGTKVTDAGLHALRGLPTLRVLSLADCGVTDAGIPAMAALPALQELLLYGTEITDDGLAALAEQPSLRVLDIRKTRVRGEGIRHLTALPSLRELRVSGWADLAARRIFLRRRDVVIL